MHDGTRPQGDDADLRGAGLPGYQQSFQHAFVQKKRKAKPLNKAMMQWFFHYTVKSPSDENNPYLAVLKGSVARLPPATVITDEIDPLMSEGKAYVEKLQKAGIRMRYKNYNGVKHEFFGMGAVVDKAKEVESVAAEGLKAAFEQKTG